MVGKTKSPVKKAAKKPQKKDLPPAKPVEDDDNDEDSDDSEEEETVVAGKALKTVGNGRGKVEESDSDDEDDDDDEDEMETDGKPVADAEDDDSDDDEEDDDDDDSASTTVLVKGTPKVKKVKGLLAKQGVNVKQAELAKGKSDTVEVVLESSDDTKKALTLNLKLGDGTALSVEAVGAPAPMDTGKSTPAKAQKRKAEDDESDDDEEDDEEESEDESDEEDTGVTTLVITGCKKTKKVSSFLEQNGVNVKEATNNDDHIVIECATAQDAQKALALEDPNVKGSELTIKALTKPKEQQQSKEAQKSVKQPPAKVAKVEHKDDLTMFVKDFGYDATEDHLNKAFPTATEIRIPRRPNGDMKGYAFVQFGTEEEVEKFMSKDEVIVNKKQVTLDYVGDKAKQSKRPSGEKRDNTTMFVKNLSYDVTEQQIQDVFTNAKDVRLPRNQDGGMKGFGFVEFDTEAEVQAAIDEHQGTEICNRAVTLDFMGSKRQGAPGERKPFNKGDGDSKNKTLVVRNLSYDTESDKLEELFSGCEKVNVVMDRDTGRSRGFAFVDFSSIEEAEKAMNTHNGAEVDDRELRVEFKLAGGGGGRGGRGGRGGGRGGGGRGGGGRGGRGGFRGRGGRGGGGRGGGGHFRGHGSGTKRTFDD